VRIIKTKASGFFSCRFCFHRHFGFCVLSFQAAELVASPIIGGVVDVELPHHGGNITAFGENPVSFTNFANNFLWGMPLSSFARHGYGLPAS